MAPNRKKAANGKGRLVSQVYEALKRKVITLELHPGEFLDEKLLMEELHVGRTPLRESILRLKGEGAHRGGAEQVLLRQEHLS